MISLTQALQLRPIRLHDQSELFSLMQRIYPHAYADYWPDGGAWYISSQFGSANLERELAEANTAYAFVDLEGRPVGITRVRYGVPCPDQPGQRASKLHRIYLDRDIQGQGVGKWVMNQVLDSCRQRQDECLWLEAMDTATASLAFYERAGFTRGGRQTLDIDRLYPHLRGMVRLYRAV